MERKDPLGVVTWISKTMGVESGGHSPMCHFYEDDDPRVRPARDMWGRQWTVVGYTDTIPFTCPNSAPSFGGEVIVYSKTGGITYLHKEALIRYGKKK